MLQSHSGVPSNSGTRNQHTTQSARLAIQRQANAQPQPPTHPDLMGEAWSAVIAAHRATQKLELLSLYLPPAEREAAQQAVARMQAALNDGWDAFVMEGQD